MCGTRDLDVCSGIGWPRLDVCRERTVRACRGRVVRRLRVVCGMFHVACSMWHVAPAAADASRQITRSQYRSVIRHLHRPTRDQRQDTRDQRAQSPLVYRAAHMVAHSPQRGLCIVGSTCPRPGRVPAFCIPCARRPAVSRRRVYQSVPSDPAWGPFSEQQCKNPACRSYRSPLSSRDSRTTSQASQVLLEATDCMAVLVVVVSRPAKAVNTVYRCLFTCSRIYSSGSYQPIALCHGATLSLHPARPGPDLGSSVIRDPRSVIGALHCTAYNPKSACSQSDEPHAAIAKSRCVSAQLGVLPVPTSSGKGTGQACVQFSATSGVGVGGYAAWTKAPCALSRALSIGRTGHVLTFTVNQDQDCLFLALPQRLPCALRTHARTTYLSSKQSVPGTWSPPGSVQPGFSQWPMDMTRRPRGKQRVVGSGCGTR